MGALPQDKFTYDMLVEIRGIFHKKFKRVNTISGTNDDDKVKFVEAAYAVAEALGTDLMRKRAELLEDLADYLELPNHVKENVKWVLEETPRPQLVTFTLQLLDEGVFDLAVTDKLRFLLKSYRTGDLRTTKEMVAKLTNHEVSVQVVYHIRNPFSY